MSFRYDGDDVKEGDGTKVSQLCTHLIRTRRRPSMAPEPEVEKATLTAAVMSTSGGMGKEMDVLVRQIATKLSVKRGERYSDTVGFVRRRIRFDLLRTCVIALRGHKKTSAPDSIRDLDFNLRPVAY